jgi:hypothetical protein
MVINVLRISLECPYLAAILGEKVKSHLPKTLKNKY